MIAQAEKEYPHECCGMIFGPEGDKAAFGRLRPCRNAQAQYHEFDPENFPRNAKTPYFIESKELLAIQKELRESQQEIRVIYHSHIEAGAYFSEEDKKYFTKSEIDILENVCDRFGAKNTKYIEDASHNEEPWKMTNLLDRIPYSLAVNDNDCRVSKEEIEFITNLYSE